jgi:NAD(P)-dependent dehydrogenase (short-subunit alcohol dehydrogenase family)
MPVSNGSAGRLAGKVAIVTGAASGIGAATVELLAAAGAAVTATDRSLPADNGAAASLVQDVTDEGRWTEVVGATVTRFGGLDILVNCAGLNPGAHPAARQALADITLADWQFVQRVNADSMMLGCRAVLPHLRNGGAIVNIASLAAVIAMPDAMAYGVSKAAIASITKSVALLAAREGKGVRCNAIFPGPIRTPTMVPPPHRTPERVPLGRFGEAREVAAAILFLVSDDATYITGAELFVDGGLSML